MNSYSPILDEISENIVYLLSLNSRLSITETSKILKINRKIVENRYKKLFQEKYIKPLLIFNNTNTIKATILLKLTKFDDEVLKAITRLSKFVKVKETLGSYDLSLLVISSNEEQIQLILNKINHSLHDSIINLEVLYHKLEDTLGYKSFCHKPELLQKHRLLQYNKQFKLEKKHEIILNVLIKKPLISHFELIKITNWSYKKIKNIIDELLENKIIRFSIDPDYQRLGLEFHNILIKINLAEKEEFERRILLHPRVHWLKQCSGSWDYILSVTSKSIPEFIEITKEIRTENKSSLLHFSSLISNIHITRRI